MILVDTSIWIDHLRNEEPALKAGLEGGTVLVHPFVAGELMLGNLHDRRNYVSFLDSIPEAPTASTGFVRDLIEEAGIFGSGIGYVDVHLIASTLILDGERSGPATGVWRRSSIASDCWPTRRSHANLNVTIRRGGAAC